MALPKVFALNTLHGAKEKRAGLRPKIVFSCIALNICKIPLGSDRALVGKRNRSSAYRVKCPEKALYVALR